MRWGWLLFLLGHLCSPFSPLAATLENPDFDFYVTRDPQISAQVALAQGAGFFKEEGIFPKLHWIVSTPELPNMVAAGGVDVFTFEQTRLAIMRGANLEILWICTLAEIGGTQQFLLGPKTKIASPKDLEKLKIGLQTGGSVTLAIQSMAKNHGVDFRKLTFVNMSPPDQIPALARGDVDAIATWEPWASKAKKLDAKLYFSGAKSYVGGKEEDVSYLRYYSGIGATKKFVERHPRTLRKLLRAIQKATEMIQTNVEKALPILSTELRMPIEDLREVMKLNHYTNEMDSQVMQAGERLIPMLLELKKLPHTIETQGLYYLNLKDTRLDP